MNFTSYLHINTSFSDHIGLSNGKSAAVLYFALLDNPYHKIDISVSFLEEVLTQINAETPLTLGSGIAGVGVLVGYLNRKGILEENPEELLASVEPMLAERCLNKEFEQIDLSSGTSGLSLYFLSRIKDCNPSDKNGYFQLYRNCIVNTVNQIDNRLPAYNKLKPTASLFTIWHGLPGIYLYLQQVLCSGLTVPSIRTFVQKPEDIVFQWLHQSPLCWEMVEAYFTLLKGSGSKQHWLDSFMQFVNKIPNTPIDFYQAAWHALLLKIIGEKHHLMEAAELSFNLENVVKETLSNHGLKMVFPFDLQQNCVPMGLERGVCGTALPLLSLETGDYDWLTLFGVELEGNQIKK